MEKGKREPFQEQTAVRQFTSLEEAVHSLFGGGVGIASAGRIMGGDINEAYGLTLTDGNRIFMKANRIDRASFFTAEAVGLHAIARTGAIGTPRILGVGVDETGVIGTPRILGVGVDETGVIGTPRILGVGTDERDTAVAGRDGKGTADAGTDERGAAGTGTGERNRGRSGAGHAFLLLEFIESGRCRADYWETLAVQLADMHRAQAGEWTAGGNYGFVCDNYIGAGRQVNGAHESWVGFFRDCRLEPQWKQAAHYFDRGDAKKITKLMDHLDHFLVEPECPSLLHGDLWSGNIITGNDGRAWLIDPAVYVGHAEADIAMTELFGGFAPSFYDAYKAAGLLQPGYGSRRDLYNLYHLLNHLNLFGRTYYPSVMRAVGEYV